MKKIYLVTTIKTTSGHFYSEVEEYTANMNLLHLRPFKDSRAVTVNIFGTKAEAMKTALDWNDGYKENGNLADWSELF